jgi:hypothetical protein
MSWNVDKTGTVKEVVAELNETSTRLSGQSKVEFDAALPHLIAATEQNFAKDQNGDAVDVRIHLSAYGHGYAVGDDQRQRSLQIHLNTL